MEITEPPTLAESALDSQVKATELVRQAKDSRQNIDELKSPTTGLRTVSRVTLS
ncbi:hypothetical protein [Vibrio sp. qd031]|uniref:hypothetical protein n=1 Tax=Vibrio sp. qd031 TaxID=1603038 RepID=UPI0015543519|nr:hypothetical protein [Vibrio sp. qd031]